MGALMSTAVAATEEEIRDAIAATFPHWTIWRSKSDAGQPHGWCATWSYPPGHKHHGCSKTLMADSPEHLIVLIEAEKP
jgi:hypothetical protein